MCFMIEFSARERPSERVATARLVTDTQTFSLLTKYLLTSVDVHKWQWRIGAQIINKTILDVEIGLHFHLQRMSSSQFET